jgi:hypothetical protein
MKTNGSNRSNIEFIELFVGDSKPSGGKSSIAWSADGKFLALGLNNIELWSFHKKKLSPLKNYTEDFIDIKIIAWSPDSTSYCCGGLNKKNSIKIRNVENGTCKEIILSLAVSSISYDPFGKYLLILLRNNVLNVYNSTSF